MRLSYFSLLRGALCAAIICFGFANVNAQTPTVIVSDDFSDGITNNGPLQIGFNTTSNSNALDLSQPGGPLDFATGATSGRSIHGLFAPQTLTNFGDVLEVNFDFMTPATIVSGADNNEAFRFGLFNTAAAINDPATGMPFDFNNAITVNVVTPSLVLNSLPGFLAEVDDINDVGGDQLRIRTHDINNVTNQFPGLFRGLLQTSNGFATVGTTGPQGTIFVPNDSVSGSLSVEFADQSLNSLLISTEINPSSSAASPVSLSQVVSINDIPASGDSGVKTTTFDFLGFSASSGAFGSSGDTGVADNGIDISNVEITFTPAPEPGSAGLLLLAGLAASFRRRR